MSKDSPRYPRSRVAASFAASFALLGLGWAIIYELAILPLLKNWGVKIASITSNPPSSLIFWRDLVSIGFDLLIIAVGVIGTWWVIASLIVDLRGGPIRAPEALQRERFSRWKRVQHWWMAITFLVCAVTGYAAHYDVLASRSTLLTVHVVSGLAMGVLAVVHVAQYGVEAVLAKLRGESLRERFPMLRIYSREYLRQLAQMLLAPFRPGYRPGPYGKYDPEQMFEYWGVYWGMAILGIPGLIILLWGPQALDGLLWVMHFKEAALAVSFIVMVHLAYAHFRPSVFPLDKVIITGKLEHPLQQGACPKLCPPLEEAPNRPEPGPGRGGEPLPAHGPLDSC